VAFTGASAVFLAAFAKVNRNGARAKIPHGLELLIELGSLPFEGFQGLGHGFLLLPECLNTIQTIGRKKGQVNSYPQICRTPNPEEWLDLREVATLEAQLK
jgi:hypothetical protein